VVVGNYKMNIICMLERRRRRTQNIDDVGRYNNIIKGGEMGSEEGNNDAFMDQSLEEPSLCA
jgi:hypothetical protein